MRRGGAVIVLAAVVALWVLVGLHLHPSAALKRPLRARTPVASGFAGFTLRRPQSPTAASSNTTLTEVRRAAVVAAMRHSWAGYRRYAWGRDELRPLSKGYTNWDCSASSCRSLGLTMIDGLDTLWVMGLKKEFQEAVDYIAANLTFDHDMKVSVFETTIRFLGGLLSAYDLSGKAVLLQRATDLGDRLVKAWTTSVCPFPLINLQTGQAAQWGWAGGSFILAEVASLQLELRVLSLRTRNPMYDEKGTAVLRALHGRQKDFGGLLPTMLRADGSFAGSSVSLGAFGDSAYEYLLKLWVLNGDQQALEMFRAAKAAIVKRMLIHTPKGTAVGFLNNQMLRRETEHLTCFAGGMFAMAYHYGVGDEADLQTAKDLAAFCHNMHRTPTGLPPDTVTVLPDGGFRATNPKYILRPETVETYFYLWRVTKDPKYRDWGWELLEACNKHLRVEAGYAGARDVGAIGGPSYELNDKMESFWLAETLKYLYLLFSDDTVLPLDEYVFNTEAHPFRRSTAASP